MVRESQFDWIDMQNGKKITFRLLNRLASLTNFIYTMHLASLLTKHHNIRQRRFLLYLIVVLFAVLVWCYNFMYVCRQWWWV